jgi:hypothetical protein
VSGRFGPVSLDQGLLPALIVFSTGLFRKSEQYAISEMINSPFLPIRDHPRSGAPFVAGAPIEKRPTPGSEAAQAGT